MDQLDSVKRYSGRAFAADDIEQIRQLIQAHPQANRQRLSYLVCEAFDWRKSDGGFKDMSCRVALLRMHREGLIALPPRGVLNVHGGMVPRYRNVHCDLWAYLRRDHGRLGTAVLMLDAGIDTGAVATQRAIDYRPGDRLRDCKAKNLELAAELIQDVLSRLEAGTLEPAAQPSPERAALCPTPTFSDLLRLPRGLSGVACNPPAPKSSPCT